MLWWFSKSNLSRAKQAKPSWFKPQLPAAKWPSQDTDHNTSMVSLSILMILPNSLMSIVGMAVLGKSILSQGPA